MTANFYDELRGLVEASGANPKDPASIYNLIGGAVKYWTGQPEAVKAYDTAATRERAETKTAEEQQQRPLQQPDLLHPGHRHEPGDEGDEGADQRGQEDVGRVEANQPLLDRQRYAHP